MPLAMPLAARHARGAPAGRASLMIHTTAVVFAHMFVQAAETAAADTPKTELTVAEAIKFLSTDPADLSEEAKLRVDSALSEISEGKE